MPSKKQLGLFDLTMIVVSLVIGMGIFRTPVTVAAKTGFPGLFFLAWAVGGLIAFCGALAYAEIGSRFPVTGAYYKIFSIAYHPSLAFAINCIILVSNAASVAAVAVIGAEYIGHFFYDYPAPVLFKQAVTIAAVGLFYIVNLCGLKMSSRVQNILILLKIFLILLLLLSVFGHYPLPAGASASPPAPLFPDNPLLFFKALGIGLIAVSFTYGGYQQTINFGEEVRDPQRTIPRAIAFGLLIILLLYLSLNFVYVKVIGFEHLKSADSIGALLVRHLLGPVGENVFRILMFLSVLTYVNALMMSNPRVMYAMSGEGILPSAFKVKTRKHDVIIHSLTVFSLAIILSLIYSATIEKMLNYTIFLDSVGFSTSVAALFLLRKRKTGEDKPIFRMRGYPYLPLFFIAAYLFVAISIVIDDPASALYGGLIFAGFFILYFAARAVKKRG